MTGGLSGSVDDRPVESIAVLIRAGTAQMNHDLTLILSLGKVKKSCKYET